MVQRIQKSAKIAVTIILKGEMARQFTAGIFYALPLNTYSVTPVWKVNASTALEVIVNRSVALFFFAANRTIFSEMTITENTCLKGNNSTQQATDAHETGFTTLIETVNDLLFWAQDAQEFKKIFHEMFLEALPGRDGTQDQEVLENYVWCYRQINYIFEMIENVDACREYVRSFKYPNERQNERFSAIPKPELTLVN